MCVNLLSESQVLFFVGVSGFIATMGAEHFSLVKFNRGFFVCLWVMLSLSCAAASYGSSRQKFEVKKHLNRLNKPPVKTIQVLTLFLLYYFVFSRFEFDGKLMISALSPVTFCMLIGTVMKFSLILSLHQCFSNCS